MRRSAARALSRGYPTEPQLYQVLGQQQGEPFDHPSPLNPPLVYLSPICMDLQRKRKFLHSGFPPQSACRLIIIIRIQARLRSPWCILLNLVLWDYFLPDAKFLHQLSQVGGRVLKPNETDSDEGSSFSERTWLKVFVSVERFLAIGTHSL